MQAKHNKLSDLRLFCPLAITSDDGGLLGKHLMTALVKMRGSPINMFEQVSYAIPFLKKSACSITSRKFKSAMTRKDL